MSALISFPTQLIDPGTNSLRGLAEYQHIPSRGITASWEYAQSLERGEDGKSIRSIASNRSGQSTNTKKEPSGLDKFAMY